MRSRQVIQFLLGLVIFAILAITVHSSEDIFEVAEHIAKLSPNCRIRVMEVVSERDFVKELADSKLIDSALHDSHREAHFTAIDESCQTEEERSIARKIYSTAMVPLHKFFEYMDSAKDKVKDVTNKTFGKIMALPAACRAATYNRLISNNMIERFKGKVHDFEDFSRRAKNVAGNTFNAACDRVYHGVFDQLSKGFEALRPKGTLVNPIRNFFGKFLTSIHDVASNVKDQIKEDMGLKGHYQPVHEPRVEHLHARISTEGSGLADMGRRAFNTMENAANRLSEKFQETTHEIKNSAERKFEEAHLPRAFDRVRDIPDDLHQVRRDIEDKVHETSHTIREDLHNIHEKAKTKEEEALEYLKQYAANTKESLSDIVDRLKGKAESGKEILDDLKESVSDKWEDVKESAKETIHDIKDKVETKYENAKDSIKERAKRTYERAQESLNTPDINAHHKDTFTGPLPQTVPEVKSAKLEPASGSWLSQWLQSQSSTFWMAAGFILMTYPLFMLYSYMSTVGPVVESEVVTETVKVDRVSINATKELIAKTLKEQNFDNQQQIARLFEEISRTNTELRYLMTVLGEELERTSDRSADISQELLKRSEALTTEFTLVTRSVSLS